MSHKNSDKSFRFLPALLALPALLFYQFSNAQYVGAQYKGQTGVQSDYIVYDGQGQPVPVNDHSHIGGTPFLQNEWAFGTMQLSDGRTITDSLVNYSLYNDRLYFRRENRVYEVSYAVTGFTIQNRLEGSAKKLFRFRNGFPAIGKNDSSTFYEVLAAVQGVQLLKWEQKKVMEVYNYGGAYESNYNLVSEYFIFNPESKKMLSLGSKPNLKKLSKELPQYKTQIEEYTKTNKADIKTEEELATLITSFDTGNQELLR